MLAACCCEMLPMLGHSTACPLLLARGLCKGCRSASCGALALEVLSALQNSALRVRLANTARGIAAGALRVEVKDARLIVRGSRPVRPEAGDTPWVACADLCDSVCARVLEDCLRWVTHAACSSHTSKTRLHVCMLRTVTSPNESKGCTCVSLLQQNSPAADLSALVTGCCLSQPAASSPAEPLRRRSLSLWWCTT